MGDLQWFRNKRRITGQVLAVCMAIVSLKTS